MLTKWGSGLGSVIIPELFGKSNILEGNCCSPMIFTERHEVVLINQREIFVQAGDHVGVVGKGHVTGSEILCTV